jgi:hypothetical protein
LYDVSGSNWLSNKRKADFGVIVATIVHCTVAAATAAATSPHCMNAP